MMPKREERRRFGKVTWDGRLVVDVDQLYRAKHVQSAIHQLDARIERANTGIPDATLAPADPSTAPAP